MPAEETTFSSIMTLPMSLAPKNSASWPIFGPIVTQLLCRFLMLSKYSRASASMRRYSWAPARRTVRLADAHEYLRMLALARLYLDNIKNLQSSWVTMGPKIGQLALFFGANDMGSVMMEENVVSSAGTSYRLDEEMICRLIRDAGWVPCQRNQYYAVLHRHDGQTSRDRRPRTPGTFPHRQHKITPEEAAAYKTAGHSGSVPGTPISIPLPVSRAADSSPYPQSEAD